MHHRTKSQQKEEPKPTLTRHGNRNLIPVGLKVLLYAFLEASPIEINRMYFSRSMRNVFRIGCLLVISENTALRKRFPQVWIL